jgi:hypothetical protein
MMDLGSKPLSQVLGPVQDGRIVDQPNSEELEKAKKKKKKKKPFSDLIYLPPRPNANLEVLTYGEC